MALSKTKERAFAAAYFAVLRWWEKISVRLRWVIAQSSFNVVLISVPLFLIPHVRMAPELRGMVSYGALKAVCKAGDDVERQRSALKKLFGSFVKCDKNVVRTQVRCSAHGLGV